MARPTDVFVSATASDAAAAELIRLRFAEAGLEAYLPPAGVPHTAAGVRAWVRAVRESYALVVLHGNATVGSEALLVQLGMAMGWDVPVYVLTFGGAAMPDYVRKYHVCPLSKIADMRSRGADFLRIPDNYYDDIEAKYGLDAATMAALRENQILYDREGDGEFFQVYTHAFDERFFFEIVERRNYHGFGAANAAIRLAAQTRESRPITMPKA